MLAKFFISILFILAFKSNAGGVDSVGGDYIQSSKNQIKAVFNGAGGFDIKESVQETLMLIESELKQKVLTPRLESIFSIMFGKEYNGDEISIYSDLRDSKYELKDKCQVHKIENKNGKMGPKTFVNKSASAKLNKKGTSICFDIRTLSQIPLQALSFQFVSLAIHEHAHHYDFEEEDAVLVQKHVLKVQVEQILTRRFMEQVSSLAAVRDISVTIRTIIKESNETDNTLCKYILKLNSAIEKIGLLATEAQQNNYLDVIGSLIEFKHLVPISKLTKMKSLSSKISNLEGFCGDDNYSNFAGKTNIVPVGDRNILLKEIEEIIVQSQEIIVGI